ncbi:uncharacterized protein LOC126581901 isoform X2 [Malus sylvestris]|uniref:uncharacterized protein LOC126581901 isoform X2 n=1 Tax=Malus sylvestris TaxID=3752 RepID=UPI0021AD3D00|nr:uncharacterized protein LOC126581901 isoform X2 [Malus sylvestris]
MTLAAKLQLKGYTPTGARRLASSTRLSLFRLFLLLPICGFSFWIKNFPETSVRDEPTNVGRSISGFSVTITLRGTDFNCLASLAC